MTARAGPFLPAAAVLAVWIAWIPLDGGYFPSAWYPAALFATALLGTVVLAGRWHGLASRGGRAALAALAALAAWALASLLWAEWPGAAWEAANQLLLYAVMAWIIALVRWRAASATAFLGAWALAVAVMCAAELVSGLAASDLGHYLLESRWQQPTGYANATAAIAVMALWPALALAARRGAAPWTQVGFVAIATFLACFSQLPQSRGALIVTMAVAPLFVALAPERARLLGRMAVVAGAAAIAARPIYRLYDAGEAGRSLEAALDHAARWIGVSVGVAALGALGLIALERAVRPSARAWHAVGRGSTAALLVLAVALAGFAVVNAGELAGEVEDGWQEFKSESPAETGPRIGQTISDKRYDHWRVSLNTFRDAPVGGAGAGNFEREYTIHRRHVKPSRSAHSIWMRTLSEGGAVGAALLVGFLALLGAGLLRARRRLDPAGRWVVAACVGTSAYFLGHASIDWLELMPALAAPAVALPFIALALPRPGTRESEPARSPRLAGAAAALLAAAAFASFALPYLSIRFVDSALHRAGSDPAGADRDFDRAAALNPLAADPHVRHGSLAARKGRFGAAERAFAEAVEVQDGWYPHYGLALLAAHRGDFARARREIARARELNPPDPLLTEVSDLIDERVRLDPRRLERSDRTGGFSH